MSVAETKPEEEKASEKVEVLEDTPEAVRKRREKEQQQKT